MSKDSGDDSSIVCPACGSPAYETYSTLPWGSRARLVVCRDPNCGNVAASEQR